MKKKSYLLFFSIFLILAFVVISPICHFLFNNWKLSREAYVIHGNISYHSFVQMPDCQPVMLFSKNNPKILSLSFQQGEFTQNIDEIVDATSAVNRRVPPGMELSSDRLYDSDRVQQRELLLKMKSHLEKFAACGDPLAVSYDRSLYVFPIKNWRDLDPTIRIILCKTIVDYKGNVISVDHIADVGHIVGIAFEFESAVISPDNRFLLTVYKERKPPHKGRRGIIIWKIGH